MQSEGRYEPLVPMKIHLSDALGGTHRLPAKQHNLFSDTRDPNDILLYYVYHGLFLEG